MGNPHRCPGCGGFGRSSLGGFCKACTDKQRKKYESSKDDPPMLRGNYKEYGIRTDNGPLHQSEYGIVKDKYGLEKGTR